MQDHLISPDMPNLVSHRIVNGMRDDNEDEGNDDDSLLFEFSNR